MDAEHLDENPFVGPSLLLQPTTNLGHQLNTVQPTQVDHELTRLTTGDLKHLGDVVEVEEIPMKQPPARHLQSGRFEYAIHALWPLPPSRSSNPTTT